MGLSLARWWLSLGGRHGTCWFPTPRTAVPQGPGSQASAKVTDDDDATCRQKAADGTGEFFGAPGLIDA